MSRIRSHAVVIGASMGGLAAARVLAERFERVTVLERDDLPETAEPRRAVPQGRQAHALLAGGARAIAALFPGIVDELGRRGAVMVEFNHGRWFQAGNYRAATTDGEAVISASRPFLEDALRRRVAVLPNVTIETGIAVAGLEVEGTRVRGVRVHAEDSPQTLTADLVVDCSGRGSPAPAWLEAIGFDTPTVDEVRCDVRYATTIVPRRPDDTDATFAVTIETPPDGKRAGFLLPIEGDRWIVTITAAFGAAAPIDEATFRTMAASLPAPELQDVISRQEVLGPIQTHRLPASRWRRFDKQSRPPTGFVALGDAICSFNPIYGQGMSSAVLQAVELGRALDANADAVLPRAFYKRTAKVIANPWKIAAGGDFAFPECTGTKPPGTDLVNRYFARVLLAAQVSSAVNTQLMRVQHLLAPPTALMRPAMVRKVLRAAREAERVNTQDRVVTQPLVTSSLAHR